MPFHKLMAGLAGVLVALAVAMAVTGPAAALETVTVQLKWTHAFQFAGYYAAQEKGYYRDAGLDVRLVEARPGLDVVAEVVDGRADFGIGGSGLLLDHHAGTPVVALAAVFQHSPLVLVARGDHFAQSLDGLAGKKVMIEPHADELFAFLRARGLPPERLRLVEHSLDAADLIANRVDAMSAYLTVEPFFLNQAGVSHRIYSPRADGIDFYGDVLFTSAARIAGKPEQVAAFREASLRGWRYAMAHPNEIIDLILDRHAPQLSRAFLRFEAAAMKDLVAPPGAAIGALDAARWRHIADIYARLGLLPKDAPVDGFLYVPPPAKPWWRVW
ncbi:ABC transporter substrate-binding protein [Novispirillum sp. DQ9]|uniref:ABC transporter substrate-binding protein n=1 Tax=Novispirillum sp. DQ9 TaxID=3398612 RepID=UPI003C7B6430